VRWLHHLGNVIPIKPFLPSRASIDAGQAYNKGAMIARMTVRVIVALWIGLFLRSINWVASGVRMRATSPLPSFFLLTSDWLGHVGCVHIVVMTEHAMQTGIASHERMGDRRGQHECCDDGTKHDVNPLDDNYLPRFADSQRVLSRKVN
jgi:hypothetical protein